MINKNKESQTAFIQFESKKYYDDALNITNRKIRNTNITFEELRSLEYIPKVRTNEPSQEDLKIKDFRVLINKICSNTYNKLEKEILVYIKNETKDKLILGYGNI